MTADGRRSPQSTGVKLRIVGPHEVAISPGSAYDDGGTLVATVKTELAVTLGELEPLVTYCCFLLEDGFAVCLPGGTQPPLGRSAFIGTFRTTKHGNIVVSRRRKRE